MSTSVGSIHYDLGLDTSKFDNSVSKMNAKLKNVGKSMQNIGSKMTTFVTLPIVAGAGFAVKAASDLEETINKVDVSFGKSADTVKEWARTSVKSMGLAEQSALDAAALFGDMGTGMGQTRAEAAKMSMKITQLAADMASFKNVSFERAQIALAGVYTGETEALKGLGIVMTQRNLQEFALSKGIKENITKMEQSKLVALRYAYAMSVTKNAQGDFARTSGGAANQTRMLGERIKQLSADIGAKLMPLYMKLLKFANKLIDKFNGLNDSQKKMILIIAGIVAAIGPLLMVFGTLITSVGTIITLFANPVFLIIAGVLAIIAGAAYIVWKNWEKIKPVVDSVTKAFRWFWDLIKPLRDYMVNALKTAIDDIKKAWTEVKKALEPIMPLLSLVGKALLIVVGVIIGSFIVAIGAAITIIAKIISKISQFIGWLARTTSSIWSFAKSAVNAMRSFYSGTVNRISAVIGWFRALPGRIRAALGNLGRLLYSAGVSLIQGFLNGITAKYREVQNKVSSMASWIKEHKGPIEKDRVLLIDEGRAIMEGFNKGLMNGYKDVQRNIRNINADMSGGITGGSSANTTIYGGINISSNADAQNFLTKLTRNQELANKGMATLPGSIG